MNTSNNNWRKHLYILFRGRFSNRKSNTLHDTSVNLAELTKDLATSKLCLDTPTQLDSLVSCYNNTISTLLERHAPMKTRTVVVRPMVPWYNEEIRLAKKERRKTERKCRRTKTATDFNL